jgi:beta-glucosidase
MTALTFPDGFLWGTATAAHQIEGGNVNADWWAFEHAPGTPVIEPSGDACDSLHRWPEDLDLVADLGLHCYRFSVEWARIEPEPGQFSKVALDHYRKICEGARERGLLPVVTFHHFTSPRWLAEQGGFEWDDAPLRFGDYVAKTTEALGDQIGLACTINEPNIVSFMGYGLGYFPPGVANDFQRVAHVNENFRIAHRLGSQALRAGPGSFPIGLTLSMAELEASEGGEAARDEFQEIMEDSFLRELSSDDFVGVQCYTRFHFGPNGFSAAPEGARTTTMGYEWRPECVGATVRRAAEVAGIPIVVTENGIASPNDADRVEYVTAALASLHEAISDGIDVRGYFLWSLLDNFEWALGYSQQFGIVGVDRATFERSVKPSATFFGQIARHNQLTL